MKHRVAIVAELRETRVGDKNDVHGCILRPAKRRVMAARASARGCRIWLLEPTGSRARMEKLDHICIYMSLSSFFTFLVAPPAAFRLSEILVNSCCALVKVLRHLSSASLPLKHPTKGGDKLFLEEVEPLAMMFTDTLRHDAVLCVHFRVLQ